MTASDQSPRPPKSTDPTKVIAHGVDEEPTAANQRTPTGWQGQLLFWFGVLFTSFHLYVLNIAPLETWTYRIIHVAGALVLGFCLMAAWNLPRGEGTEQDRRSAAEWLLMAVAVLTGIYALGSVALAWVLYYVADQAAPPAWISTSYGVPLLVSAAAAIVGGWTFRDRENRIHWPDWILAANAITVAAYLILVLPRLRLSAGTAFSQWSDFWAAFVGTMLILELTRRVAGLALVVIAAVFIGYSFVGPWLPGFLSHQGYDIKRFFTYIYTDNGILGPTTAVSSTYIILFIAFAAFLNASKVGDYFVNFAFAVAGRSRGGPAKVAVFASGLMGMINGTSAGNVVATGSLTIPLMKKVGYRPQSAGAIEAAASTGGQIMPPIMGAGAFIMAEITGIPYSELIIAAIIPAVLYFISIYFMVDLEATKMGMKGMHASELPRFKDMAKQAYLFVPVVILIGALFMNYTVIRAGTLALVSAVVVSWLSPNKMGVRAIINALSLAATMSIQIIAVVACAGVIVGVIALTGVGARFSALLLGVASSPLLSPEIGLLLAMFFAMVISIVLGMGMPTTAAYAVAASVVAPGLRQLGIEPLVAHFFVFYFAVISAITPPVALASYAAAAISGADAMRTSVTSFKIGLAAFIVPFMFFYSPAMLMEGDWLRILHVAATATLGVYLLSAAVQGWYLGRLPGVLRFGLLIAALFLIKGGWITDMIGVLAAAAIAAYQFKLAPKAPQPAA